MLRRLNRLLDEGHASEVVAGWFHLVVALAYIVMAVWHLSVPTRLEVVSPTVHLMVAVLYVVMLAWHLNATFRHWRDANSKEAP